MELPTVRVKHPDPAIGVMVINESDFDPAVHDRVDDGEVAAPRRRRATKESSDATD
jgi:hypothetical protein